VKGAFSALEQFGRVLSALMGLLLAMHSISTADAAGEARRLDRRPRGIGLLGKMVL